MSGPLIRLCLAALLSLVAGAAFAALPTRDMPGKKPPQLTKTARPNAPMVSFTFVLDKTGAGAILATIDREIENAQNDKNSKKETALKKIRTAFIANPARTIKQVYVAGPFTGWDSNKLALKAGTAGGFTTYSVKTEVEFSINKEQYKYVFTLNAGTAVADAENLWVADPTAVEFVDDGFGGKNSLLVNEWFVAPEAVIWNIEESADPLEDARVVTIKSKEDGYRIVIVFASGDVPIPYEASDARVSIRTRFDSDPPGDETWAVYARQHYLVSNAESFLKKLRTGKKLVLRFIPYASSDMQTRTLEIEGLEEHVKGLEGVELRYILLEKVGY